MFTRLTIILILSLTLITANVSVASNRCEKGDSKPPDKGQCTGR